MSTLLKPSSCEGCPYYTKGKYFTPDTIVPNSKVLFLAQAPGENEEKGKIITSSTYISKGRFHEEWEDVRPQPLLGRTGQMFNNKFLKVAGLKREEISLANALRCRPGRYLGFKKANDLPSLTKTMKLATSKANIVKALNHCRAAHLRIPDATELIVTMGGYALFQLTGQKDVMNWRGYGFDFPTDEQPDIGYYNDLSSNRIIFSTMHIAALFQSSDSSEGGQNNKRYYHAVLQDFNKIKKILNKEWPLSLPNWSTMPPTTWPRYAAFDTEYTQEGELTEWSLCDLEGNLYQVDIANTPDSLIPSEPNSTVITQNALADINHLGGIRLKKNHLGHYLEQLGGIVDMNNINIEDLMLAHAILFTGEPHSLNYIQSIFGGHNRHKHLSGEQSELYSALDAWEPLYIWRRGIMPAFKQDPQSYVVYKTLMKPLINIINKSQLSGSKVNTNRLQHIKEVYENRLSEIQNTAREITGDSNFNIGGRNRVLEEIYGDIL